MYCTCYIQTSKPQLSHRSCGKTLPVHCAESLNLTRLKTATPAIRRVLVCYLQHFKQRLSRQILRKHTSRCLRICKQGRRHKRCRNVLVPKPRKSDLGLTFRQARTTRRARRSEAAQGCSEQGCAQRQQVEMCCEARLC